MTEQNGTEDSPRGYHDIGGDDAGAIPKVDLPWLHWEKQTEAIRIISLDEMRRGFESFGADKYKELSFYRRRLDAMIDILIEKQVVTRDELDVAIEEKRAVWAQGAKKADLP